MPLNSVIYSNNRHGDKIQSVMVVDQPISMKEDAYFEAPRWSTSCLLESHSVTEIKLKRRDHHKLGIN